MYQNISYRTYVASVCTCTHSVYTKVLFLHMCACLYTYIATVVIGKL